MFYRDPECQIYDLRTPDKLRIVPDPKPLLQKTFYSETEEDNVFEVQKILEHRKHNDGLEYLVNWSGYPHSDNIWEPDTNLTECRQHLARYHQD
jgi:hypothetical protein